MPKSSAAMQMSDIARLAGVSKSTVSRALADSPLVNERTKTLIKKLAKENNYRVNVAARNFRLKENLTVALAMPAASGTEWTIADPFFLEMTVAVAQALDARGHALLLSRTKPQTGEEIEDFIGQQAADGLILIGQGSQHEKLDRIYQEYESLSVWGGQVEGAHYPIVGSDNVAGGRMATEHLLQRGCKTIAFVGYREEGPEYANRFKGYQQALEAAGHTVRPEYVFTPVVGELDSETTMAKLVAVASEIDAVFATSDLQAVTLMHRLLDQGYRIPEDIAIVGYDDLPLARQSYPALTTVRQPTAKGAEYLVENLLASVEGGEIKNYCLAPELVVRDSA